MSGRDNSGNDPLPEARGTLLRARNGDVLRYDETGIVLRLSDRVIADIAARLSRAPAAGPPAEEMPDPEILGDIDAWNLRRSGDWLLFEANLPGAQGVRQFRRLADHPGAEAAAPIIADAPGALLGIFSIGGARAAHALPRAPLYPWHILGPGDDIGAVGMGGTEAAVPVGQPGPLREVTRDAALAEALLSDRQAHHRALPLYVVRAETDASASAAALACGPAHANLLTAARSLAGIAASLGKRARILAIRLDYSLEDVSGDAPAHRDGMLGLMRRLTEDLGAQGFRKPVFLATFDCGTPRLTDAPPLRAQAELAWNTAGHDLVYSAPGYMFAQDDYARPTAAAMQEMAAMEAAALTAVYDGAPWFCPTFLLAEREGARQIRVRARAMTDLVLDAADPFGAGPAAGFRLEGGTAGARITGVACAPDDPQDILLTLDRAPEGAGLHLLYGFGAAPRAGARPAACGAVRDLWAAPCVTGALLHRWALPCALPVH